MQELQLVNVPVHAMQGEVHLTQLALVASSRYPE